MNKKIFEQQEFEELRENLYFNFFEQHPPSTQEALQTDVEFLSNKINSTLDALIEENFQLSYEYPLLLLHKYTFDHNQLLL